jgi:hypothetical protein
MISSEILARPANVTSIGSPPPHRRPQNYYSRRKQRIARERILRTPIRFLILTHTNRPATMDIRVLQSTDIPHVQQTNITNLPENYFCKYYMYHALSWPALSYVAVDVSALPYS